MFWAAIGGLAKRWPEGPQDRIAKTGTGCVAEAEAEEGVQRNAAARKLAEFA